MMRFKLGYSDYFPRWFWLLLTAVAVGCLLMSRPHLAADPARDNRTICHRQVDERAQSEDLRKMMHEWVDRGWFVVGRYGTCILGRSQ